MLYSYLKDDKAFYAHLNDDGKTVATFDLVVPKVGTIISRSQNGEQVDIIRSRIKELGLPSEKKHDEWYLYLCRHRTAKHSGFTLRFDLTVLFTTGLICNDKPNCVNI